MPEGPSANHVVKVLQDNGFQFIQQRGSHAKFRSQSSPPRTVIVPMHRRNLAIGTFRSICRQAGLSPSDF